MNFRRILSASMVFAVVATSTVQAQECADDIKSATESIRQSYVNGMGGVANSNFSMRPGSFSKIGCLDKFMKGDMDIFFRPPSLDSLLEQVISFACEAAAAKLTGAAGGGSAIGKLSDMVGGLNIPSSSSGASLKSVTKGLF
jgi:hypothetical protein